jgi:NAD(P)-dependent dehydrogenase (short-subunit alcohol dehydrogenase family)
MDFKGKVAVVTGAGRGIGQAIARMLGERGASVAVLDIQGENAEQTAKALGQAGINARAWRVDVRDLAAVEAAAREIEASLGGIDLLVNNAGGGSRTTIDNVTSDDWDKVLALNLSGPFHGIKAVVPSMRARGGGSIVNVASLAAIRISHNAGMSYSASKAGVLGLTRHAAFELSRDRIRVNAVLPGPVLTERMRKTIEPAELEAIPRSLPLGEWLAPEDIAGPVLFFCSDLSKQCTGTYVVADGGLHIGPPTDHDAYFRKRDGGRDHY